MGKQRKPTKVVHVTNTMKKRVAMLSVSLGAMQAQQKQKNACQRLHYVEMPPTITASTSDSETSQASGYPLQHQQETPGHHQHDSSHIQMHNRAALLDPNEPLHILDRVLEEDEELYAKFNKSRSGFRKIQSTESGNMSVPPPPPMPRHHVHTYINHNMLKTKLLKELNENQQDCVERPLSPAIDYDKDDTMASPRRYISPPPVARKPSRQQNRERSLSTPVVAPKPRRNSIQTGGLCAEIQNGAKKHRQDGDMYCMADDTGGLHPTKDNRNSYNVKNTSSDIKEWMEWRMQVNGKLGSFILNTDIKKKHGSGLPVDDLPNTMSPTTMQVSIQKSATGSPKTSLDKLSYLIYGIPRVSLK